MNIIKVIGFFKFIKSESKFKEKKNKEESIKNKIEKNSQNLIKTPTISVTESLINFFLSDVLTDKEKVALKKLEFTTNKAFTKKYKRNKC